MTHTLHRQGNEEALRNDYVIFAMPSSGLNSENSKPKLERCYEIFQEFNPKNIGDSKNGSKFSLGSDKAVEDAIEENELVHAVYTSKDKIVKVLKALKKEDLGLSVTVSGLVEHVDECCQEVGLKMHTINNSLGIWGNTSVLPDKGVQEISSMCGHGLVSFTLINQLVDKVKEGKLSSKDAAEKLAKPCICGVFNPVRAEEVIERMSD